jgi:hypothetical protein
LRDELIAFTFGELGIFIAFVLIFVIAFDSQGQPDDRTNQVELLQTELAHSKAEAERLRNESQQYRDSYVALRDSIRSLDDLRSKQRPSCQEKGVASGFLFTAEVSGPNNFRLGQATFSFSQLVARFSSELAVADSEDCVHQVNIQPAPGLSGEDLAAAIDRIQTRFFYRVISSR